MLKEKEPSLVSESSGSRFSSLRAATPSAHSESEHSEPDEVNMPVKEYSSDEEWVPKFRRQKKKQSLSRNRGGGAEVSKFVKKLESSALEKKKLFNPKALRNREYRKRRRERLGNEAYLALLKEQRVELRKKNIAKLGLEKVRDIDVCYRRSYRDRKEKELGIEGLRAYDKEMRAKRLQRKAEKTPGGAHAVRLDKNRRSQISYLKKQGYTGVEIDNRLVDYDRKVANQELIRVKERENYVDNSGNENNGNADVVFFGGEWFGGGDRSAGLVGSEVVYGVNEDSEDEDPMGDGSGSEGWVGKNPLDDFEWCADGSS